MTNADFKTIATRISKQDVGCVGEKYKKELAEKILLLKPVGKLEVRFHELFVQKFFSDRSMISHSDLGDTKLARLDAVFGTKRSKNEIVRVAKMLKYIQNDMNRHMFRYDFLKDFDKVETLVQDLLVRSEKLEGAKK